jgi:hypothetical protein
LRPRTQIIPVTAWHNSAEYKENRAIGDKYAKFRFAVVEGLPQ